MKKSIIILILSVLSASAFSHQHVTPTSIVDALSVPQSKPKQVLPKSFTEDVQYTKSFKMGGKNYTLYFIDSAKTVRSEKNVVTYIYIIPDDFSYKEGSYGEALNSPPMMISFIYHDLGDMSNKDYCTVLLRESDQDASRKKVYIDYVVRLPDEIADILISLANGDMEFKPLPIVTNKFTKIKEDDSLVSVNMVAGVKTKHAVSQDFDMEIQFKKHFKMEGKNYTLYYCDTEKRNRAEKKLITDIYLIPETYEYKRDERGKTLNSPPLMTKFIYHDLGDPENKNYCSAILREKRGNDAQHIQDYTREVRLPDKIATDIINLLSGETEFRIVDSMIGIYSEVTTP